MNKFDELYESVIEEKKLSMKGLTTIEAVGERLDSIPQLKKYRIKGAQYDDTFYAIPMDDWKKYVGWTEADLKKIHLDEYEGGIMFGKDDNGDQEVQLSGGA